MAGRRVLLIVWRACPSPPPLDSGLRRNDEVIGGHIFVAIAMPAGAGTPRYEKQELWFGTANRHGGFC